MYAWKQLTPSVTQELGFGTAFGMTDTGTVRGSNEDNFLIDAELGLFGIADGMGGHARGEIASADGLTAMAYYLRTALASPGRQPLPNFRPSPFKPTPAQAGASPGPETLQALVTLHDAVEFTNQRMFQTNVDNRRGNGDGMGTTLSGLWRPGPGLPLLVFHVGDTRVYRFRDGKLTLLTHDQTMYQQALDAGLLQNLPTRNLLLQAIGPASAVSPDLKAWLAKPDDVYLLCSDGLHGASLDDRIAAVLEVTLEHGLAECCAQLIEAAKLDGSRDNITVLLLQLAAS